MYKNKFTIKNKNTDPWASFLFREMQRDEKRPSGPGWMDIYQLDKICKMSFHTLRCVLNDLRSKGECELHLGNVRNDHGFIQKHVWYRLKKGNWKTYFKNHQYQKDNQRLPDGKDWYTVGQITNKTGLARSKILRLIKQYKVSNKVKVFDGYKFNPAKRRLERKIWYKLCLNGFDS